MDPIWIGAPTSTYLCTHSKTCLSISDKTSNYCGAKLIPQWTRCFVSKHLKHLESLPPCDGYQCFRSTQHWVVLGSLQCEYKELYGCEALSCWIWGCRLSKPIQKKKDFSQKNTLTLATEVGERVKMTMKECLSLPFHTITGLTKKNVRQSS